MLTKTKKKIVNNKKSKIFKNGKNRDVVDSYLSTKFGINSLDGFWENAVYERMTDDGRPRHGTAHALLYNCV